MKISANNNDLKRYFKEIKSLFPTFGKNEKLFFSEFMNEAEDCVASNDISKYNEMVSYFGKPNVIVSDYLENADAAYLIKSIKTATAIKRGIAIVVLLALVAVAVFSILNYKFYTEARDAYIHREVIQIEEIEEDGQP